MNAHSLRLRALSGMRWTVARELVHVMLSDKWQQAIVPLTMPSLAAPPRIHTGFLSTVNNAAGRPGTSRAVAPTSVVLLLGILLGTRLGVINNAATSWIIVYPLVFLVSTIDTCRVTERSLLGNLHLTFIACVAGLCMFASTFLSRNLLAAHLPVAVLMGVEIAAATATFVGLVQLLGTHILRDGRAPLRDLLRPGRTATAEIAT